MPLKTKKVFFAVFCLRAFPIKCPRPLVSTLSRPGLLQSEFLLQRNSKEPDNDDSEITLLRVVGGDGNDEGEIKLFWEI